MTFLTLIRDACRAEELFTIDELEEYAMATQHKVGDRVRAKVDVTVRYRAGRYDVVPTDTEGTLKYYSEGAWGVEWDNGVTIEVLLKHVEKV